MFVFNHDYIISIHQIRLFNTVFSDVFILLMKLSVSLPTSMSLTVSENGDVYTATNAHIINNSSNRVKITGVTLNAAGGWTIVAFRSNMASVKVDSKRIGFQLNGLSTGRTGFTEDLVLRGDWTIEMGEDLPLMYDAKVSATSVPITDEHVLDIIFVVGWAE